MRDGMILAVQLQGGSRSLARENHPPDFGLGTGLGSGCSSVDT
ncbi:hypothetical protein [Streptomyces cyaneofuscatus]